MVLACQAIIQKAIEAGTAIEALAARKDAK